MYKRFATRSLFQGIKLRLNPSSSNSLSPLLLLSPNPASAHLLRQMGVRRLPLESLTEVGCLYVWAQTLSGLAFPRHHEDVSAFDGDQGRKGEKQKQGAFKCQAYCKEQVLIS